MLSPRTVRSTRYITKPAKTVSMWNGRTAFTRSLWRMTMEKSSNTQAKRIEKLKADVAYYKNQVQSQRRHCKEIQAAYFRLETAMARAMKFVPAKARDRVWGRK